ncbi:MAG: hypothetical protein SF162_13660 [bacterium]|nr:hypothetical protein [bacterium]
MVIGTMVCLFVLFMIAYFTALMMGESIRALLVRRSARMNAAQTRRSTRETPRTFAA